MRIHKSQGKGTKLLLKQDSQKRASLGLISNEVGANVLSHLADGGREKSTKQELSSLQSAHSSEFISTPR